MRRPMCWGMVLAVCALPMLATPVLAEKQKWEYAELVIRSAPRLPPKDGADAPPPQEPTIRWITSSGELEAKGFAELAEKVKGLEIKKDASATLQRIQLLNFLGGEGWELMSQTSGAGGGFTNPGTGGPGGGGRGFSSSTTMVFKRRVQ